MVHAHWRLVGVRRGTLHSRQGVAEVAEVAHFLTDEQRIAIARKERGTVLVELAHCDQFWLAIYRADTATVWDVIHAMNKAPTHLEPGGGNGGSELTGRQEGSRVEDSKAAEQSGAQEGTGPSGQRAGGEEHEPEGKSDDRSPGEQSGSVRVVDCEPGGDKPPGTRHL